MAPLPRISVSDPGHISEVSPRNNNAELTPKASSRRNTVSSTSAYDVRVSSRKDIRKSLPPQPSSARGTKTTPGDPLRPKSTRVSKPAARSKSPSPDPNASPPRSKRAAKTAAQNKIHAAAPAKKGPYKVLEDELILDEVAKNPNLTRATWQQIADKLGRSADSVSNHYTKSILGSARAHDRQPWQQDELDTLLQMHNAGSGWVAIAKQLNRSVKNCKAELKTRQHDWTDEDDVNLCEAWLNMHDERYIAANVLPFKSVTAVRQRRKFHTGAQNDPEPSAMYRTLQIAHNNRERQAAKDKKDAPTKQKNQTAETPEENPRNGKRTRTADHTLTAPEPPGPPDVPEARDDENGRKGWRHDSGMIHKGDTQKKAKSGKTLDTEKGDTQKKAKSDKTLDIEKGDTTSETPNAADSPQEPEAQP